MKSCILIIGILFAGFLLFGCTSQTQNQCNQTQAQSCNCPTVTSGKYFSSFDPLSRPRTIYVEVLDYDKYLENSGPDVFRDAFAYWERKENVTFVMIDKNTDFSRTNEQNSIFVEMVKEGGYSSNGRAYVVNPYHLHEGFYVALGDHRCRGVWQAYTYDTVLHLVTHELGHILGYWHNNNSTDLMGGYPGGFGFYRYVADINTTETIPYGWTFPYFPCSAPRDPDINTTRVYKFDVTTDKPMDIYVVPSEEEYQKAMQSQSFNYFNDCYAQNSYSLKKTCTTTNTSLLFVRNVGGNQQAGKATVIVQEVTPLLPYEQVFAVHTGR